MVSSPLQNSIMVTLILGQGRKHLKSMRCIPISAQSLNISYEETVLIDNDPNEEPDILYDLRSGKTLPFDDNSVDLVVDTGGLGGVLEWFKKSCFWKEMHRIMKSGAAFHGNNRHKPLQTFPIDDSAFAIYLVESKTSYGSYTAFVLTKKDESI